MSHPGKKNGRKLSALQSPKFSILPQNSALASEIAAGSQLLVCLLLLSQFYGGAGVREEQNRHGPALAYAVQAEE